MFQYLPFIVLSPFIGGLFHFLLKDVSNMTYVFNSFAGGIILGAGIMHSMPDAINGMDNNLYPMSYLLIGLVILFLYMIQILIPIILNTLIIKIGQNSNDIIKFTALWISIFIHGIFEGFSVGTLLLSNDSIIIMCGLFIHKIIEYIALGSRIIKISNNKIMYWVLIFLANIPCVIAFCISSWYSTNSDKLSGIFASLTCGTFLYLSMSHIIPETLEIENCCLIEKENCNTIYANVEQNCKIKINKKINRNKNTNNNIDKINDIIDIKQLDNCENGENKNCDNDNCENSENGENNINSKKISSKFKLLGFFCICLGFSIFALLALINE